MITRVWGKANGADVVFEHDHGTVWNVSVPWTEDGKYQAEIWAENAAGRTSYLCAVLFVISGHELQCYVVPRGYEADPEIQDYSGFPVFVEYVAEMQGRGFDGEYQDKTEYEAELQERGYTIERTVCRRCDD